MARVRNSNSVRTRLLWWTMGLSCAVILGPLLWADVSPWSNARADWWREVREGVSGYSAVRGLESGELIQASGEFWRQLRNGPIAWTGGLLLGGVLAALSLFYLTKGPLRLQQPRTGIRVPRWSRGERLLHWSTALLFLTLALTGISILYGRTLLIPWMGHEFFSSWLIWSKYLHNVSGPLFVICLLVMTLTWFRDNGWRRIDLDWFKALGGMLGGAHPPAGRMNAGEKAWFWLLVCFGAVVCVSGVVLLLPLFGLGREWLQLSHLFHVGAAIVLMAGALSHIYIGSIGTEGALEGMLEGSVDLSWAKQHHALWLEEEGISSPPPVKADKSSETSRPTDFFRPNPPRED